MVLFHLLCSLAPKNKWQIAAAHLNHQLRGRSSDADERLVARTAKRLGVPIFIGSANIKKLARTGKLSLEMAARKARHEFLAETAARLKFSHVALAHHADDQIELFFLRLLRGSGSEGLSGMKWRNASPANARIQLVRPLLEQSKESLRDYAAAEKIPFREDASNEWLDIQRNRIRRELLPLLRRKYQPALGRNVLRLMEMLRAESEFVAEAAEAWIECCDSKASTAAKLVRSGMSFEELPLAVQRRSIQLQLLQHGIPADFAWVERLRTSAGKPFTVMPQVAVSRDANGKLEIRESFIVTPNSAELEIDLRAGAGETVFGDRTIQWTIEARARAQEAFRVPPRHAGREMFDADKIGPRLLLRHWRPGDRFQPIGMSQPVKLQDLFTNQKIPQSERRDLIVAVTPENEVFWVEKLRISERFKLTPQTARRLVWRWKAGENRRLRVSAHHVRLAQR